MNKLSTSLVIGIRFQKIGKVYHFDASQYPDLKVGDFAVVVTSRGSQLGEIVKVLSQEEVREGGHWKAYEKLPRVRVYKFYPISK